MHPSVEAWGKRMVDEHGLAEHAMLEVGSLNVNGSLRRWFTGRTFGVDLRAGPGVDYVGGAASLPFDDGEWPVVVCTEMLEHDPTFWLSVPELARVLEPGGWLLLSTRGIGFPKHEHPSDYWRFTPEAIRLLVEGAGLAVHDIEEDEPAMPGVLCAARKPNP